MSATVGGNDCDSGGMSTTVGEMSATVGKIEYGLENSRVQIVNYNSAHINSEDIRNNM